MNICNKAIGSAHIVIYIVLFVLIGIVLSEGTSGNKKISWILYACAIVLGLINIILSFFLKCRNTA